MIGGDYARTLVMPTQSLPVGDTTSPTALCSESHMNTQHTVTGECGHYCCTSEAMAVKAACTTNHPVILHLLGAIVTGGKVWGSICQMHGGSHFFGIGAGYKAR